MKKLLPILLMVLAAGAAAGTAHAQQTITLDRMVIEVWPEFDQREALVIYSGQVTPDATAPLTLRITLPETAELNAVAYRAPAGLLQADYTLEGNIVVMTTDTGLFHVEFYDPAFTYAEQQRSYGLTYAADYTINELIWSVQQPPDAAAFQADPAPIVTDVNNAGLTVVEGSTQGLQPGDPFSLSFDYTRVSDELVVEALSAQQGNQSAAAQSANPTPTTSDSGISTGTIIAIAVGAGFLVGAGIYMAYMGGPQAALEGIGAGGRSRGRSRRRDKPLTAASRPNAPKPAFCGQCGERIESNDKFCRHCGSPV